MENKLAADRGRNHALDFLRFAMSVGIVLYHILHKNIIPYVPAGSADAISAAVENAYYLVEFFLILGGFFLWGTLEKAGKEFSFFSFLADKVARLWPVLAFEVVCALLLGKQGFAHALQELFFLRATGLSPLRTGILWYIGPYFWIALLFGGLYRTFGKEKTVFAAAVLAYVGYCANFTVTGGFLGRQELWGIVPLSVLRVGAGISVGFLYGAFRSKCPPILRSKTAACVLYTAAEAGAVFYLTQRLFFGKSFGDTAMTPVLMFLILLHCFAERKGLLTRLLDRPLLGAGGKFAYSIYVMQQISFYLMIPLFWKRFPVLLATRLPLCLLLSTAFSAGFGILTYCLVERPAKRFLSARLSGK
ncbi:MAG: acyltransferase family protein [Clostridia bacterium]|nr:acyltransferase family protein [Clostridia bacterium]